MDINEFKHQFKYFNGIYITKDVLFFRRPVEIWNSATDESVTFKSVDDALAYQVGDKTVADIVRGMQHLSVMPLSGGRGASGGGEGEDFDWSGKPDGKGRRDDQNLNPAILNSKIKTKTAEAAIETFNREYGDKKREYGVEITKDGYVTQLIKGEPTSVGISADGRNGTQYSRIARGQKTLILHNHPNASAFSREDMMSTALDNKAIGIVASGTKYDYIMIKTNKFKANEFLKHVQRNKKVKGKDVNEAVHNFLSNPESQKKFGYHYERRKAGTGADKALKYFKG